MIEGGGLGTTNSGKPKVNFILPILPDKLFINQEDDNEIPKNFSLRTIFGSQNIKELKTKMKEEKRMKDKEFVMSPNSLRSPIIAKTQFENLEGELDTIIDSNQINLIKYLSSKNFSDKTIHKIANYDESQKIKINKLCQIAEHNEDNLKKIIKDIHNKVTAKEAAVKGEFKEEIDSLREDKNIIERIIASYPVKVINKQQVYHEQINDIKKIWKNYHLSRYGSRMKRNNSMLEKDLNKAKYQM